LGAFDIFLTAVFYPGLNLLLGFIAGSISNYFQQKLKDACRIGIIIILKQPPCFWL
jgi:hypothetical protein